MWKVIFGLVFRKADEFQNFSKEHDENKKNKKHSTVHYPYFYCHRTFEIQDNEMHFFKQETLSEI
jgi:hypothetical protein